MWKTHEIIKRITKKNSDSNIITRNIRAHTDTQAEQLLSFPKDTHTDARWGRKREENGCVHCLTRQQSTFRLFIVHVGEYKKELLHLIDYDSSFPSAHNKYSYKDAYPHFNVQNTCMYPAAAIAESELIKNKCSWTFTSRPCSERVAMSWHERCPTRKTREFTTRCARLVQHHRVDNRPDVIERPRERAK